MTSVQGNVVQEVLGCIATCSEHQAALAAHEPDLPKLRALASVWPQYWRAEPVLLAARK